MAMRYLLVDEEEISCRHSIMVKHSTANEEAVGGWKKIYGDEEY